jgi:hypothetical protein
MSVFCDLAPLKNARPADFFVTAKEPQWQFVLKPLPTLTFLIVLLDLSNVFEQNKLYYYRQAF